ncbi:MAG: hypothetical protein QM523_09940 [Candidatus Pacebacteria bacterium]|nr:hypothetical protein [Candidatus Paceibacterota bacterium]
MATIDDVLNAINEQSDGLRKEITMLRRSLSDTERLIMDRKVEEANLLAHQLGELSRHITKTKREIASMPEGDKPIARIASANYELDAIVKSTEVATENIMNSAEHIQNLVQSLDSAKNDSERNSLVNAINNEVVRIFEHCNFQDVTGQRISKVVKSLDYVTERINGMIDIWTNSGLSEMMEAAANDPDKHAGETSQGDIDRLFS